MPVDSIHCDYLKQQPIWQRIRDCIAGAEAIRARRETYLPRLHAQEDDDYNAYLQRANFYNATKRTHEALVGFVFRKPPEIVTTQTDVMADANLGGLPFLGYARRVIADVCSVGRCGTLIDWSNVESRPYLSFYRAEDIINWRTERIDGRMMLTLLVLRETYPTSSDGFETRHETQYRVYRLMEAHTETPYVQIDLWRRAGDLYAVVDTIHPTRRAEALPEIPFIFHNAETVGDEMGGAPLADISSVNISHFQTSADLENGRHVAGTPTPYLAGFDKDTKFYLGSSYAWVTSDTNAKAGFVEFNGQGLAALEKAIAEKEAQMAALGARLIEQRRSDAEAYDTVALRASAETSALARISDHGTDSLSLCLAWCAWWTGTADISELGRLAEESEYIVLSSDFNQAQMRAEMLTALSSARIQGLISQDAYFHNLSRGQLMPEGRTLEEELAAIANSQPPSPVAE